MVHLDPENMLHNSVLAYEYDSSAVKDVLDVIQRRHGPDEEWLYDIFSGSLHVTTNKIRAVLRYGDYLCVSSAGELFVITGNR